MKSPASVYKASLQSGDKIWGICLLTLMAVNVQKISCLLERKSSLQK